MKTYRQIAEMSQNGVTLLVLEGEEEHPGDIRRSRQRPFVVLSIDDYHDMRADAGLGKAIRERANEIAWPPAPEPLDGSPSPDQPPEVSCT